MYERIPKEKTFCLTTLTVIDLILNTCYNCINISDDLEASENVDDPSAVSSAASAESNVQIEGECSSTSTISPAVPSKKSASSCSKLKYLLVLSFCREFSSIIRKNYLIINILVITLSLHISAFTLISVIQ